VIRLRRHAPAGAALVLCLLAGACGGSGDDPALKPADVQRFVAVKQATDNLTRLVQLTGTADDSVNTLAGQRPGSAAAQRTIDGALTGWNNVLVGLGAFSPAQAAEAKGLTEAIVANRQVAINWSNVLGDLKANPPATKAAMLKPMTAARKKELKARGRLTAAAASLAKAVCSLERAHPELAPAGAAQTDCQNADRLAQAVSGG
jgi:hypothetical protein